ncbi:MAG TPA: Na+/H+ antiporter NhaC family protein [Gemmatimonadaceae bacterium]|nr:Na+/H+ antiporter NhaC family protein [Gemmatimonadaceae bacterium]
MRFPHPLALLVGAVLVAAALSWILPAGEYDRRQDEATGRTVVVSGTYHHVARTPVGAFQAIVAVPKGMADAASVIFLVFLIGGAFTVVDRTGALRHGVDALVRLLGDRRILAIPIACVAFATAGALENMQEEIIALIPVLLLLTRRMGYDALTAVAMSLGAAAVGAAFSPVNPFQAVIAQKLAGLPALSGAAFRLVVLGVALAAWIWWTMRHARRSLVAETANAANTANTADATSARESADATTDAAATAGTRESSARGARSAIVLALVLVAFAIFIYGILRLGWDFDQMSALFFAMGVLAGLVAGLGVTGTAEAFVDGFRSMAYAGLLIGFARAIFVVLQEGHIIDTIVHGLFAPLAGLPVAVSAVVMMVVQTAVHVPVPSVSGQAALTMPVVTPLSDLLGLSRQVSVLAYQGGAGLCDMWTPTNGALMAILAAAEVRYGRWLRFLLPAYAMLFGIGVVAMLVGIAIGLR